MAPNIFNLTREWLDNSGIAFLAEKALPSTNDLAKSEAFAPEIANEKIYLADAQTKGRGRGTNTWLTPPSGHALLITWSWGLTKAAQPITGPLLGLHIYRAILKAFSPAQLNPLNLSIKTPNDIYLREKKMLGILAEAVQQGNRHRLIVGIGLNVFSAPAEVETAGCLSDAFTVTANLWFRFLDALAHELRDAVTNVTSTAMGESDCYELLTALRRHPSGARYTRVLENGDLQTITGDTLSWRNL